LRRGAALFIDVVLTLGCYGNLKLDLELLAANLNLDLVSLYADADGKLADFFYRL
jgi:hypothetical protein